MTEAAASPFSSSMRLVVPVGLMKTLDIPASPFADAELESDRDEAAEQAVRANRQVARRRRAYWILGLSSVAIVVALIAAALYVERTTLYQPAWKVTERLAEEGSPTTWEEAQAAAPRPPEELDGTTEWDAFLEKHGRSLGQFDRLAAENSLQEASAWMAELRTLAASGKYRVASYPLSRVAEDDYMVILRELDYENAMSRFLVDLAKKRHDDGDVEGAADSLALSLALTANAKYEPFLVCKLSGAARFGYAADGVEPLVVQGDLSSDRLVQLQQALARCDLAVGLDSMRLHELLIQRDYAIDGRLADVELNLLEARLARHSFLRQLELLDRLRIAQSQSANERLAMMLDIEREFERLVEEEEAYTTERLASVVHAQFRSRIALQDLAFVEAGIRRSLLIAAIACRRFELDRGDLPKDWNDLAEYGIAEAPTNPWIEGPMTLERLQDGSVAIGCPWAPWAVDVYEERRESELDRDVCEGITLSPRTKE